MALQPPAAPQELQAIWCQPCLLRLTCLALGHRLGSQPHSTGHVLSTLPQLSSDPLTPTLHCPTLRTPAVAGSPRVPPTSGSSNPASSDHEPRPRSPSSTPRTAPHNLHVLGPDLSTAIPDMFMSDISEISRPGKWHWCKCTRL